MENIGFLEEKKINIRFFICLINEELMFLLDSLGFCFFFIKYFIWKFRFLVFFLCVIVLVILRLNVVIFCRLCRLVNIFFCEDE